MISLYIDIINKNNLGLQCIKKCILKLYFKCGIVIFNCFFIKHYAIKTL